MNPKFTQQLAVTIFETFLSEGGLSRYISEKLDVEEEKVEMILKSYFVQTKPKSPAKSPKKNPPKPSPKKASSSELSEPEDDYPKKGEEPPTQSPKKSPLYEKIQKAKKVNKYLNVETGRGITKSAPMQKKYVFYDNFRIAGTNNSVKLKAALKELGAETEKVEKPVQASKKVTKMPSPPPKKASPPKKEDKKETASKVKKTIPKNKFGLSEDPETNFVFDPKIGKVIGKQVGDKLKQLQKKDIDLCNKKGFNIERKTQLFLNKWFGENAREPIDKPEEDNDEGDNEEPEEQSDEGEGDEPEERNEGGDDKPEEDNDEGGDEELEEQSDEGEGGENPEEGTDEDPEPPTESEEIGDDELDDLADKIRDLTSDEE